MGLKSFQTGLNFHLSMQSYLIWSTIASNTYFNACVILINFTSIIQLSSLSACIQLEFADVFKMFLRNN